MQRAVLVGWVLAFAIVAAVVGYWLVGTPDARAKAATASAAPARETPVFLREPDAPRESAPEQREQVEKADEAPASVASTRTAAEAIVVGRAVDRLRRPLADVVVASKYPVLETRSGTDGRFELRCPNAGNGDGIRLRLSLQHSGYGAASVDQFVKYGDTFDAGEVVLPGAGAVSGRVVDESGAPFAQAEVRVTEVDVVPNGPAYHRPWNSLADGASDANGKFRIADVRAGSVRVWAGADEHLWAVSDPLDVPELGEVFDVVLTIRRIALEDTIRLTVVDPDGNPVPRAHVTYFVQRGGSSWSGSTDADEQGRYTHHLSIRAPHDFGASDSEQRFGAAQAKAVLPGTLDLVLRLTQRRALALTVVDESGKPVTEFSADVRGVGDGAMPQTVFGGRTNHDDGRLELAVPPAPFEIVVDATGYAVETLGPYDPASAPAEVRATLKALPRVRGVVTADGHPAAGAAVSAHLVVESNRELVVNGFRARTQNSAESRTTTDLQGEFVLTPRKDGRYVVRAELDGWAPGESEPLDVDTSAGASGIAIELVRGGAVEGHALPGVGETPAGLIIGASRGDGFGVTARTNADGKFRFERLTPGRWWIGRHDQEISPRSTTSSSGDTSRRNEIEWNCVVRDGETTRVEVPAPAQDAVVLHGRLAFGGKPAAGWKATMFAQRAVGVPSREAKLDEQGRFDLSAKEAGDFYLNVSPGGTLGSEMRVTQTLALVDGPNSWDVDLPVGAIDGRIASSAIGDTDQYVWSWHGSNGLSVQGSLAPASDGAFKLSHAPAGTIQFAVWPSEGQARDLKSIELGAGATLRVDL